MCEREKKKEKKQDRENQIWILKKKFSVSGWQPAWWGARTDVGNVKAAMAEECDGLLDQCEGSQTRDKLIGWWVIGEVKPAGHSNVLNMRDKEEDNISDSYIGSWLL